MTISKRPALVEHSLEDGSPHEISAAVEWQRLSEHNWGRLLMVVLQFMAARISE